MRAANHALDAFRLDGKVAVVTGASGGLGSRMAEVLHGAGASVVLAARRADRIEALAAKFERGLAVACDVTDAASRRELHRRVLDAHGAVDVLVNNAGIEVSAPAEDETLEDIQRVIDVNLVAPFALAQLFGRSMLERGSGSIVNVGSIMGVIGSGRPPLASYAASKGGIVNLTRDLAVQWARRGVRVNALCPGWFPSEMTAEMMASDAGQRYFARNTPLGRPGHEDELDGALLFLASDASAFVTGQALIVDGGWTAR